MFTENEKTMVLDALLKAKSGIERAKAKATNPRFGPIYDEDLKLLAALAIKVTALEVSDGKGKVSPRS